MSDVVIQVSRVCKIQQIEDFPEKCARSRKGSLHMKPGATLTVTRDELKHLKAKYERTFMVVGEVKAPPAEEAEKPAADGDKGGSGDSTGDADDKPDAKPADKPAKGGGKGSKK